MAFTVEGKKALVIGGGKTGFSGAKFLKNRGAKVVLYDDNQLDEGEIAPLRKIGVEFAFGSIEVEDFNLAVVSPGVPLDNDIVKKVVSKNIELLGEIELAAHFISKPLIGITGTNGKTTTTTLIGEIFKNSGKKVFVGGNIGVPLLEGVDGDYDCFVVEMSSFQLETITETDAALGLILNLTPDHLNRHGTMAEYLKAKANLVTCQSQGHIAVLNYDDSYLRSLEGQTKSTILWFSTKEQLESGVFVGENGDIIYRDEQGNSLKIMNKGEICIPGPHNLENSLGAIAVALKGGVAVDVIKKTLAEFPGVEHRLEKVRTINGVLFVNDSKGTNPDAVMKALQSYEAGKIVLLAGGKNKGVPFDDLAVMIKDTCKYTVLAGDASDEIAAALKKQGYTAFEIAPNWDVALSCAVKHSESGDVVLLSPANTSFDAFKNFEERGAWFKKCVHNL